MSALSKRRRELRSELATIEKQIYDLETNYLEDTKEFGNIFTGWQAYLSHERVNKPRKSVLTEDRLFSLSSVTSPASKREEFKKSGKAAEANAKRAGRKKAKQGDTVPEDDVNVDDN